MHISVLSLHTSPAAQPGQGDAGGMNVYVDQSVRALAAAGHVVDVFTADPGGIDGFGARVGSGSGFGGQADTIEIAENVRLHQLPIDAATKDELADAIDELALLLLAQPSFASADLIWAHYWISAEAALRAHELRTQETAPQETVPPEAAGATRSDERPRIVVSMHTIGAVKNRDSETSHERPQRLQAEEKIASAVDLIVAGTPAERRDLIHELGADADTVVVARPGVDHELFTPGDQSRARAELGLDPDEFIVLYVGRMQFIKGTDIVVDAISGLRENNPHLASRTRGILLGAVSGQMTSAMTGGQASSTIAGGESASSGEGSGQDGAGLTGPSSSQYLRDLATAIAAEPSVEVRRPVPAHELVTYYRAADVLLVPSRSESFGLVAAEASASGLPAIASAVGGLPDIVEHGHSGVLIADHNPRHWAMALERLLLDDELRRELSCHSVDRSTRFDWSATVAKVLGAIGVPDLKLAAITTTADAPEPTTSLVGRRC
ncbi:D-inositol-3-phosphate glycosyltransferase [Brevibacterium sandarakinum]|uniref:D-inositol 3-phosphate glycosyltransferase n=1 Tax=Brevibacterium sandarakinum TaxID=629680 RepID=A0A1H1U5B0_BRESA|nr:glycosyltransferase [Brevibacterium sandarakinum]SDS67692.1 D-inositol-3-phosphate glycosyltransferase [Brevibacterium sandarakinum]